MRKRKTLSKRSAASTSEPRTSESKVSEPTAPERRLALVTDLLASAAWGVVAVVVLINSVPEHAVGTSSITRDVVKAFLPEGWAFFTRNPREATERFFAELPGGQLVPGSPADTRGIPSPSRAERVRSIEIAMLLSQVPKDAWKACSDSLEICLAHQPERHDVAVRMNACSYQGPAVVQRVTPVPWAWRASYENVHMPSAVVRLNVTCTTPEKT
jgi:antimicrobial peptide system SdpA family protein